MTLDTPEYKVTNETDMGEADAHEAAIRRMKEDPDYIGVIVTTDDDDNPKVKIYTEKELTEELVEKIWLAIREYHSSDGPTESETEESQEQTQMLRE